MEESGELGLHGANHWEQSEAVQEHGEGTPLGHAGLAEKRNEFIAGAMDNQESVVFVTVEGKKGTTEPFVTDNPEHGGAIETVEGIGGIDLEDAKFMGGILDVFRPEFVGSMDAPFNAGLQAATQLSCTAGLGGLISSHTDDRFGHDPVPDLTDCNGAGTTTGFAKSKEAIAEQCSNSSPGNQAV
jgi:hypothetical protein